MLTVASGITPPEGSVVTPRKDVVDCAQQLSVPRKMPSRPLKMFLILPPCFEQERKTREAIIRGSACGGVKTSLSMESMRVLDGSQPLAKWQMLSTGQKASRHKFRPPPDKLLPTPSSQRKCAFICSASWPKLETSLAGRVPLATKFLFCSTVNFNTQIRLDRRFNQQLLAGLSLDGRA